MWSKYKQKYNLLISSTYSSDKRFFDRISGLWIYFLIRPVSFLLAPIFILLNISANSVTFLSFLIGIMALFFGAQGEFILSAVFYNLFLIFDCVDGTVARVTQSTRQGEYLDAITGDLINFLFIPSLGIGVVFFSDSNYMIADELVTRYTLLAALSSSIFYLLAALFSQRKKNIFGHTKNPTRIGKGENIALFEIVFRNSFGVAFNAPMLIIFAYIHGVELLIFYNFVISFLILVAFIFQSWFSVFRR